MTIQNRIRKLMIDAGMSQKQLKASLEKQGVYIDQSNLSKKLNGQLRFYFDEVDAIYNCLNQSLDDELTTRDKKFIAQLQIAGIHSVDDIRKFAFRLLLKENECFELAIKRISVLYSETFHENT